MPFADELLGVPAARALAAAIHAAAPQAPLAALHAAAEVLSPLTLRERSDLLRDALLADLPGDYDSFAGTIRAAAAGTLPFTGWLIWPVTTAVAVKAVDSGTDAAFDDGLRMLAELTPRLTSEFAIRLLLAHDLDRALPIVLGWTASTDADVRRLASEGTRPFLPWAIRVRSVLGRPDAALPILHALHADESDFVRRSVANHLNDLARENADLVVQVATAWMENPGQNTRWVVRHGLRTLIKKGNPGALALLGFETATVTVTEPALDSPSVTTPGELGFTFEITNDGAAPVRLAIDYVVHYVKSNGTTAGKVFKLTTATLAPGETTRVAKRHGFRPMTTRVHYAGTHSLQPQVNGQRFGGTEFELVL